MHIPISQAQLVNELNGFVWVAIRALTSEFATWSNDSFPIGVMRVRILYAREEHEVYRGNSEFLITEIDEV